MARLYRFKEIFFQFCDRSKRWKLYVFYVERGYCKVLDIQSHLPSKPVWSLTQLLPIRLMVLHFKNILDEMQWLRMVIVYEFYSILDTRYCFTVVRLWLFINQDLEWGSVMHRSSPLRRRWYFSHCNTVSLLIFNSVRVLDPWVCHKNRASPAVLGAAHLILPSCPVAEAAWYEIPRWVIW